MPFHAQPAPVPERSCTVEDAEKNSHLCCYHATQMGGGVWKILAALVLERERVFHRGVLVDVVRAFEDVVAVAWRVVGEPWPCVVAAFNQ